MSVNVKQNGALVRVAGLYESVTPIGLAEKYSTEERQVGVSIDGKPIYKKSYITTTNVTLGTSWSSVVFTVANVEKPIKAELIRYTGSAYTTYPIGCNNDNGFKFVTFTGNINCQVGSIFTVWYTKTTDTPGSGIYASDEATLAMLGDVNINTPTDGQVLKYDATNQKWVNGDASGGVNYSTTERKVGTWIDGRDVYEKSIQLSTQITIGTTWTDTNIVLDNDIEAIIYAETMRNTAYAPIEYEVATVSSAKHIRGVSYRSTSLPVGTVLTIRYIKTAS